MELQLLNVFINTFKWIFNFHVVTKQHEGYITLELSEKII